MVCSCSIAHLLAPVIAGAAHVDVRNVVSGRWRLRIERLAVQAVFENGLDAPIGGRLGVHGSCAGRFQSFVGVALSQMEEAEAGTVSLFGVRLRSIDLDA